MSLKSEIECDKVPERISGEISAEPGDSLDSELSCAIPRPYGFDVPPFWKIYEKKAARLE